MGVNEVPVVVKLLGQTDQFTQAMKRAQWSSASLGKKMQAIGGVMKGVGRDMTMGATVPIAAGLALCTKAAIDEEKAMAVLSQTVRKNTGATREQVDALEKWITKTAYATGVADDDLRPALSKLTAVTHDVSKAQGLLGKAMDISAATGKPLEAVTSALQKAYLGNVGGLSRLGIATKDAKGETMSFKEIMAKATETYGGAAAKAADTTAGRMAILRNKIADLSENLGTQLIPIVEKVVGFISGLAEKFNGLSPSTQRIIVIVGLVVAAIGPLLMVLGQIITIAPMVGTAFTVMTGPVGIIIAAIAAVVAVFVLLWTKCDWFRNFWIGLWEKIKAVAQAFWDWAGPTITAAASAIWSALQVAFDKVKAAFEFVWPYVKKIVQFEINAIITIVKGIGVLVGWVRDHWDTISGITKTVFGVIKGVVQAHITAIVNIVKGISAVVGFVRDAFNTARDVVETVGGKLKSAASAIWDAIKTTASTAWGKVTGVVKDAWSSIAGYVNKIIRAINWVLDNVPGLGGVARIPQLPTFGGDSMTQALDMSDGGSSPTPTVPTPATMPNGGMGGPEAQGADSGKVASGGGGRGGLGGDTASWISDIWDKFGIGAQLPQPVGGLFGGATNTIYDWAKTAIVGLLKKFADRGDRNSIIEFAKSMLGVPYLWGGTSPGGFDCSGLIYWAYQQAGIKDFPRIPTYGGKQIPYSQIQPADVLFYYPNAVQDGQVVPFGHFKMYEGGGYTIESTSGGVQERPVQSGYAQIRTYLADGGIVMGPTVAMIGERGPEAVIPLDRAMGLTIQVDARYSTDPAATYQAAKRGAIAGYAEAKRRTRMGAGR